VEEDVVRRLFQLLDGLSMATKFFPNGMLPNDKISFASFCPITVILPLFVLLTCSALMSCGGGGGGTASGLTTLTFSGTAATGLPISSATVNIQCNGTSVIVSSSANTDTSGAYSAVVSNAAYPCMLQVADGNGNMLHSYLNADGVANITPLTDAALAASLSQEDLSTIFAGFNATQITALQSSIAQGKPEQAWDRMKTQLTSGGVDASAISTNPFSGTLQADTSHLGTGHDKVLDDVGTKGYLSEHLYRMAAGLTVPPVAATGKLNDTGIDWCSENITTPGTWVNNMVCSTFSWVGNLWGQQQDAWFGRDAQALAGTLQKYGGGVAGFDFTKISSKGKALPKQDGTWSDSGTEDAGTRWDCVRDNVTGLMWEVKRNDATHLRYKGHTFTWFNSNSTTNGGNAGTELSSTCKGVADETKCNTQSYVTAVNAVGLCGKKDWRMPTMDELFNLAHGGLTLPAIDANYFPNTGNDVTWTSSPYADSTDKSWFVSFSDGYEGVLIKSNQFVIRLVRTSQ